MLTAEFDYELPESAIAQHPAPRGESRLLVLDRSGDGRHQRIGHAPPDPEDLGQWQRALLADPPGEGLARHVLGGDEHVGAEIGRHEHQIADRDQVRVGQAARPADLADQVGPDPHVAGQLPTDHLQGDRLVADRVVGPEDRAVAPGPGQGQAGQQQCGCGHQHCSQPGPAARALGVKDWAHALSPCRGL